MLSPIKGRRRCTYAGNFSRVWVLSQSKLGIQWRICSVSLFSTASLDGNFSRSTWSGKRYRPPWSSATEMRPLSSTAPLPIATPRFLRVSWCVEHREASPSLASYHTNCNSFSMLPIIALHRARKIYHTEHSKAYSTSYRYSPPPPPSLAPPNCNSSISSALPAQYLYWNGQSKAVSNILKQCYGDPEQVTEELVECILTPGLEPGAVKVCLSLKKNIVRTW